MNIRGFFTSAFRSVTDLFWNAPRVRLDGMSRRAFLQTALATTVVAVSATYGVDLLSPEEGACGHLVHAISCFNDFIESTGPPYVTSEEEFLSRLTGN